MGRRTRRIALAAALVVALAGSVAYVTLGLTLYQQYHLAYANYRVQPDGPCGALLAWSPPPVLYTGLYVNQPALMSLRYRSATPQTLRITMSVPGLTQEQTLETAATSAFQTLAFKPPLLGDAALDTLPSGGERQAELRVRIEGASEGVCEASAPLLVKSRQWMRWSSAADLDNLRYIAGWVTPQADVIHDFVGRAAAWLSAHPERYPDVTALRGYTSDGASEREAREQVNALFDTLQFVYHVRYAQDNVAYNQDAEQLVQLPRDVLARPNPTAMCVETTAILASAVERLGMRPFFIFTPGHVFLGVALGAEPNATLSYWETSALSDGVWGSQANEYGESEFASDQGPALRTLDVQAARRAGVVPIE